MRRILFFIAAAAFAAGAQAQIKCWNENGRRVCGDAPPPGARVTTLRGEPAPAAPAAAAKDAKRPLTPAEQEAEFRKRQAEAAKSAEKAAEANKESSAKRENCERAKEALRSYETGRVMRIDAQGERYFLDEAQIAQESAKARQVMQESCN